MVDLSIRCECGSVVGVAREISPSKVNRVVCHCRGCTAYAHVLGRAEEILDGRGGTEVFQMSPRQLSITAGIEQVDCIRLTDRGALRWFAKCCKTPIAHTLASLRVPFMAINHLCVEWHVTGKPRDQIVGPIRARINGQFARAEAASLAANRGALISMLLHYSPLFLWWFVRGDARHSPFLDAKTRKPIIEPEPVEMSMALPAMPKPARGCG